ncbi:MAG: class I SAM-dependent methyltransferase [Planctomycetes bacterium]|nr:class I SAM-dependent methyltransferase [Planctomycetota bacterium]
MSIATHVNPSGGADVDSPVARSRDMKDYHERFANYYDLFYESRDIAGEVKQAIELIAPGTDGNRRGLRVFDFGCGTGSHAVEFAGHGFDVVGYDIAEAMLAKARSKCATLDHPPQFVGGDINGVIERFGGESFDCIVSFFNVLNCIPSVPEIARHLAALRTLLKIGGRGLLAVWNGAASLADQPHPQVRRWTDPADRDREIIRFMVPELDRINQVCRLNYQVLTINRRTGAFEEFQSEHDIHLLTPVHYRHLLATSGFQVLREFPQGRSDDPLTTDDWFATYLVQ